MLLRPGCLLRGVKSDASSRETHTLFRNQEIEPTMRPLKKEEIQRKVLHIFSGSLIPIGIFYIPWFAPLLTWLPHGVPARAWAPIVLAVILLVFGAIEFMRLKVPGISKTFNTAFGSMLRKEESTRLTGATYIFAASLICSIVFYRHPHISVIVLSTFIWGDAVAALVGQSMGRIRIGKKSLEGSAACLVVCLLSYLLLFPVVPGLLDAWNGRIPLVLVVVGSLCVTIMELFPIHIGAVELNDNLTVPVITGAVLLCLYPLVA